MDDFNCCLADFGLALVTESPSLHEKSLNLRGSVRWMSPEILDPKLFHLIQPKSRDIYAFGCTVVEVELSYALIEMILIFFTVDTLWESSISRH